MKARHADGDRHHLPGTVLALVLSIGTLLTAQAAAHADESGQVASSVSTTVTVTAPATVYRDTVVNVTAQIVPWTDSGSVRFYADEIYLGTAEVSTNAQASIAWHPVRTGSPWLIAEYSGGGNGDLPTTTGRTLVTVLESNQPDQISVVPVGGSGPWVPSQPITMTNGSSVQITATAASQSPVSLAINGPCSIDQQTLQVYSVGGNCILTASSNGGNGYSASSVAFTIVTAEGTQTATLTAPASGRYKASAVIRLGSVTATTNIGKRVTWQVTSGKRQCKVTRKGPRYLLELAKPGTCQVAAYSPAVPGQWASFSESRTYRIRR